MSNCVACDDPSDRVWLMLAASPEVGLCDRCAVQLGEIAALGTAAGATSPDFVGPCRLCGTDPSQVPMIVSAGTGAPICHACAGVARRAVAEQLPVDDPWYRPLRNDTGGWVAAAGAGPVDVVLDEDRMVERIVERLSDRSLQSFTIDTPIFAGLRRRAIAEALGEALARAGRVTGWDAAFAWVHARDRAEGVEPG